MGFTSRRLFCVSKVGRANFNRMKFQGKDVITWSINDYLGLANHPEVRKVDAEAGVAYGSAYPMGANDVWSHFASRTITKRVSSIRK